MSIPKYDPTLHKRRWDTKQLTQLTQLTQTKPTQKQEKIPNVVGYGGADAQMLENLFKGTAVSAKDRTNSHFSILSDNRNAANPPGGRIFKAEELTEELERELVKANGGQGFLAPYESYNPDAEPVVMVHGIKGHPGGTPEILEHYAKKPDKQVYLYFYDDKKRYLNRSAGELGVELEKLRSDHLTNKLPSVTLISHSMGGPLTQGAMKSLADPNWYPEDNKKGEETRILEKPCAEKYAQVKHLSVDAPWRGYGEPAMSLRKWLPVERSWMDMLTNSKYMERLHEKPLPDHFINQHIEANYEAGGKPLDSHIGWQRLDNKDFASMVSHFAGDAGALKNRGKLRQQLKALRQEEDYPKLEPLLKQAARAGELDRQKFMEIMAQGINFVPGDHSSIAREPQLLEELEELDKHE